MNPIVSTIKAFFGIFGWEKLPENPVDSYSHTRVLTLFQSENLPDPDPAYMNDGNEGLGLNFFAGEKLPEAPEMEHGGPGFFSMLFSSEELPSDPSVR